MRPQADDYPDFIERAVQAILNEGVEAGAVVLQPIAYEPRVLPPRPEVTRYAAGQVFLRDRFHCRYCLGKIIPTPIMELLGSIYPTIFPFDPYWSAGRTHPAILSRSGVVDHITPAAWGGSKEETNLVAACNPCNSIKADFALEQLGWEVQQVPSSKWDGLTGSYAELWKVAGKPKPRYHRQWMYAFHLEIPSAENESES